MVAVNKPNSEAFVTRPSPFAIIFRLDLVERENAEAVVGREICRFGLEREWEEG